MVDRAGAHRTAARRRRRPVESNTRTTRHQNWTGRVIRTHGIRVAMSAFDVALGCCVKVGGPVTNGAVARGAPSPQRAEATQWFGHPRGLSTLFFTEMWERFSYYGMRALLVLFMTAPATEGNPGLGYGEARAGAIYGLYTSLVYLLALPGGWV